MSDEPAIVHMRHVREADLCAKGVRRWCLEQGINWPDFITNGTPADELEATGDPVAQRVAAIARKESENGRK